MVHVIRGFTKLFMHANLKLMYTMKTKLTIAFLLISKMCLSQVSIQGKILSVKDSLPLAFVGVQVMDEKKTQVISLMSNENGGYSLVLPQLKNNNDTYSLRFRGTAVKDTAFVVKGLMAGGNNNRTFYLMPADYQLKEVKIAGRKKALSKMVDRWVLTPSNDLNATGKDVFETLRLLPGTSIVNDKISVNGKSGVNYLINGQSSIISSVNIVDLLKGLSPDQIERIELMTSPPAKYSAEGTAAIINIVLKKNKLQGYSGKISSQFDQGKYSASRNAGMLGYKTPEFETNLFVNANFNTSISDGYESRVYNVNNNPPVFFDNSYLEKHKTTNLSLYQTFNWDISERSNLNVEYQLSNSRDIEPFNSRTLISSKGVVDSVLKTLNYTKNKSFSYGLSSTYHLKLDSGDHQNLEINASYFTNNNPINSNIDNQFLFADGSVKRPGNNNIIDNNFKGHLYGISADYVTKARKGILWESGLKYSRLENISDFKFLSAGSSPSLQLNKFKYHENTTAAYVSSTIKIDSTWNLKIGLRAEYSKYQGGDSQTANLTDSSYLKLFPTVFVSKTFSEKLDFSFSYGRRILRPDFRDLNPFQYYYDPYSYLQGNPFLKPYIVHNFEGELGLFNTVYLTLGYSMGKNVISDLTFQDDVSKIVYSTKGNIANQKIFYSNINSQIAISKFWNLSVAFSTTYNDFQGSYSNYNINNRLWSWSSNLYNNFKLGKNWRALLGGWINGPSTTGIDKYSTIGSVNVAFEKKIKLFTIQFGVDDLFNSRYERVKTQIGNQNIALRQLHDYRRGWIKLSFSFDNNRKWLNKEAPVRKENFNKDQSRIEN
jgi:outer membrane receptor protein involved in Fe transport